MTFVKGESGNPAGRPVGTTGSISITGMIRDELEKCPEGETKKTYADLIIKRILSKAIKDGDGRMIEKIWAYMDGLPSQSMDVTSGGEKLFIQISSEIAEKNDINSRTENNSEGSSSV